MVFVLLAGVRIQIRICATFEEKEDVMVTFKLSMGGFDVLVDGKLFGYLQKGDGFFTDSTVIKDFMKVSSADLTEIARKADEVKTHGNGIPICKSCKGTQNYPQVIYNPNEGEQLCQAPLHPFNIRYFGRP